MPWVAVTAGITVAVTALVLTGDTDGDGDLQLLPWSSRCWPPWSRPVRVTALLPRLGRRGRARLGRLSPAPFLALSRVAAGRGAVRLVVVTTALALGLVVQAGALADSAARTVDAKAAVAAASDVVVPLLRRVPEVGTRAGGDDGRRAHDRTLTLVPGGRDGRRAGRAARRPARRRPLGPGSWPTARWRSSPPRSGTSRATGCRSCSPGRSPRPRRRARGRVRPRLRRAGRGRRPGRRPSPGRPRGPLLVADRDGFAAAIRATGRDPETFLDQELWARGEAAPLLGALTAAGWAFDPDQVVTAGDFAARPELSARAWSFGHLRAVAALAGLLGLTGLALQAVAQQRRRAAASRAAHPDGHGRRRPSAPPRRWRPACSPAWARSSPSRWRCRCRRCWSDLLDPVPAVLPGPLFAVPWGSLAAVVAGAVLATVAGALLTGRAARQADGGRVMRDAT